jgi:hypothetical protein
MSDYESVLSQYDKIKATASKFVSSEERLRKYFTTVLPKGSPGAERRIRILPTKDGSSPFVEVYFHEIQVDGKWLKIWDPKQEGQRSPLNELRESLEALGDKANKELARNYRSRKFFIVKLIDREHEADGPKFWRFKHNSKSAGPFDKIVPIIRLKGDIFDPAKGRDLILSLALTKSNNEKYYTTVNSVMYDDPCPLHEDPETAKAWLEDTLTWSDVYSKRPVEYLEMVARGETPKWSTDSKKWVSGSTEESSIGGNDALVIEDIQVNDEPDENLPF